MLTPYIDPDYPNPDEEIQRCSNRFIPQSASNTSLAYRAIYTVNERICSALAMVVYQDNDHDVAIGRLRELMEYLAWSIWEECQEYCRDNEFCAIPIWPQGTINDYESPRCQRYDSAYDGDNDYWGPVWH